MRVRTWMTTFLIFTSCLCATEFFEGIEGETAAEAHVEETELSAYVHLSAVEAVGEEVRASAGSSVYAGPGTNFSVLSELNSSEEFPFLSEANDWYKVEVGDLGSDSPQSETPEPEAERQLSRVTAQSGLNFREAPNGRILRTLPYDTRVEVLGTEGRWTHARVDGDEGYLFSRYLTGAGDDQEPSPAAVEPRQPDVEPQAAGGVVQSAGEVRVSGVPEYRQRGPDPYSSNGPGWRPGAYCGPTSFQMVMSFYGIDRSRDYWGLRHPQTGEEIRSSEAQGQMYVRGQGAHYGPMVRIARQNGFPSTSYNNSATVDDLRSAVSAGRPQIISIGRNDRVRFESGVGWNSRGHVVVVVGVRDNGAVIVHDPGSGREQVISASEFRATWKNNAVDIRE